MIKRMTRLSRSVRHRYALRGLPVPEAPTAVQVHIELRDADGVWQSFLILPGQERLMTLVGFVDNANGWQRITLPVNVRARVV